MGDRLTDGLGRRGHWVDMLGGGEGQVNEAIGFAVAQRDGLRKIPIDTDFRGESRLSRNTSTPFQARGTGLRATTLPRPSLSLSSARIPRSLSANCL